MSTQLACPIIASPKDSLRPHRSPTAPRIPIYFLLERAENPACRNQLSSTSASVADEDTHTLRGDLQSAEVWLTL